MQLLHWLRKQVMLKNNTAANSSNNVTVKLLLTVVVAACQGVAVRGRVGGGCSYRGAMAHPNPRLVAPLCPAALWYPVKQQPQFCPGGDYLTTWQPKCLFMGACNHNASAIWNISSHKRNVLFALWVIFNTPRSQLAAQSRCQVTTRGISRRKNPAAVLKAYFPVNEPRVTGVNDRERNSVKSPTCSAPEPMHLQFIAKGQ